MFARRPRRSQWAPPCARPGGRATAPPWGLHGGRGGHGADRPSLFSSANGTNGTRAQRARKDVVLERRGVVPNMQPEGPSVASWTVFCHGKQVTWDKPRSLRLPTWLLGTLCISRGPASPRRPGLPTQALPSSPQDQQSRAPRGRAGTPGPPSACHFSRLRAISSPV